MNTVRRPARSAACPLAAALLVLLVTAHPARSAFEVSWPDAPSAAVLAPSALFALPSDLGSGRGPADSSAWSHFRAVVSAGQLYGLREAAGWGASATAGFDRAVIGIELSRLGSEIYEERSLSLSVRLDAGPDLDLNVRVRGLGIAAGGIDDLWTGAVDAGATKRLMGRFLLSAACENLTHSTIGESPVTARTGFGAALVLPSVSMQWTLLVEEASDPSTVLGIEATLADWLRVRAGVRDSPGRLGLGFGAGRRGGPWPSVDVSVQWHPQLGASTFVSVTIEP